LSPRGKVLLAKNLVDWACTSVGTFSFAGFQAGSFATIIVDLREERHAAGSSVLRETRIEPNGCGD